MILMGVVNLTPDSFREDTRAMSPEAVEARVGALLGRGCSIIDFGAVSTRPGAPAVSIEDEWSRLAPALSFIEYGGVPSKTHATLGNVRGRGPAQLGGVERSETVLEGTPPYSIDTTSAEIVRRVYERIGPFIVNDISAGEDDPDMLPTVARLGLPYIAMHKRGNPRSMDKLTDYPEGIVKAVDSYFQEFEKRAASYGIKDWILDPGFGFAKTVEQNWELLENIDKLKHFGRPLLIGVADKRFTRTREAGYAERLAEERGADILRIH
ncbi:MAG: dihydropteroate synthase [Bacteroidales bacterium]|nr:dihydropteroate synthase [Bacteroidales bacterium]